MSITAYLIGDTCPVELDEQTASIGGAFYNSPHLQPYSPVPLKWCYDQLLRYPHAVMLDVGASGGAFSLLAKHHPDLMVYAFEPTELGARILRENIYLNGLTDKVTPLTHAVSNYCGKGTMHVVKPIGGLGVSMLDGHPAWHKDCENIEIDVMTIDALCLYGVGDDIAPTLIKIDVEGNEKAVLEGARQTIEKYHPFICVEISAENTDQYGYPPSDIIKMLEGWNYTWTSPEGLDAFAVWREWDKDNAKPE